MPTEKQKTEEMMYAYIEDIKLIPESFFRAVHITSKVLSIFWNY